MLSASAMASTNASRQRSAAVSSSTNRSTSEPADSGPDRVLFQGQSLIGLKNLVAI